MCFWIVRKARSPLSVLQEVCDAILTVMPHSMGVEHVFSSYNISRLPHRLSMSDSTIDDILIIAMNGPPTEAFDPRPSVKSFF
jgi:hypothetical protein